MDPDLFTLHKHKFLMYIQYIIKTYPFAHIHMKSVNNNKSENLILNSYLLYAITGCLAGATGGWCREKEHVFHLHNCSL